MSTRAPIRSSGAITRRIGRRLSEASPVSVVANGCAASTPISSRVVVPELPASSGPAGGREPAKAAAVDEPGRPAAARAEGDIDAERRSGRPAWTGNPRRARGRGCVVRPVASAASTRARCEIDLSPGTRTVAPEWRAGRTDAWLGEETRLHYSISRVLVYRMENRGAALADNPVQSTPRCLSPNTTVRLRFSSAFEMLDMVQVVSDHVGRLLRFDEDALTWMEVAVRESVINAIKHGNRSDRRSR